MRPFDICVMVSSFDPKTDNAKDFVAWSEQHLPHLIHDPEDAFILLREFQFIVQTMMTIAIGSFVEHWERYDEYDRKLVVAWTELVQTRGRDLREMAEPNGMLDRTLKLGSRKGKTIFRNTEEYNWIMGNYPADMGIDKFRGM